MQYFPITTKVVVSLVHIIHWLGKQYQVLEQKKLTVISQNML